jgi:NAD(P)-dependent dehydrogenase (short-subunit alcohol dehydrogenase family)
MSTWLITGCSTGLGRALAEAVIAAGHNAVVTARDVGRVADLAVDDYADTAGKRRKEHDTAHGTQPGDPAKAAQAIIAAVESDEPPAFLLLGNDALKTYRRLATARLDTIEAWEHLTTSTDIGA